MLNNTPYFFADLLFFDFLYKNKNLLKFAGKYQQIY